MRERGVVILYNYNLVENISMKYLLIILTSLLVTLMGCSSSENTSTNDNIQIIAAKVNEWSQPPSRGSDVPERGSDLSIVVSNWSDDFTPKYIIHNNKKSISAAVTDTLDGNPVITGRIIRSSYRLSKTSETVSESDRLVYETSDGEITYIEIKNWKSSSK